MRTLLNIIWLFLGGIWLGLGYLVAGVVACILVVTIPAGLASFRMARYVLWPFGSAVVRKPGAGAGSALMNLVWFIVAGWWLAALHVAAALAQSITIVGIANAVVSLKMIPVSLFPFGRMVVARSTLAPGDRPLHSM